MAVAVKNTPETSTTRLLDHLWVASLAGTAYVLASIAVVFHALPYVWWNWLGMSGSAVSVSLLAVVMLAAGLGLIVGAVRLVGPTPRAGLRAGTFFGLLSLLVVATVTCWIGAVLQPYRNEAGELVALVDPSLGAGITLGVAAVLLLVLGRVAVRPWFEPWLVLVEEQGWFDVSPYKRTQGQRVRRGTMLGLLILAGCGVYTMLIHKSLETGPRNWSLAVPFTEFLIPLLPDVSLTLPLLLSAASLWVAYRVVNFPTFADFLIATEAELNKVSWTTRKRLIQDTIVVLMTVALLTSFLFVVDMVWARILAEIGVLQVETDLQRRYQELVGKQQSGELTPAEQVEMQRLAEQLQAGKKEVDW